MSKLNNLINNWKLESEFPTFNNLFSEILHKEPLYLRYTQDRVRPDLFLIHQTEKSDQYNEIVRECNGIILRKSDLSIVSYGPSGFIKVETTPQEFIDNPDDFTLTETDDGTLLKVFYYEDKWVVSTNRRIDASRVKWSSNKNFFQLFLDAFSVDYQLNEKDLFGIFDEFLSQENTYTFILLHPENQNVIYYRQPELVFVSSRNKNSMLEDHNSIYNLKQPNEITTDQFNIKMTLSTPLNKRGVIFENKHTKVRYIMDYTWFKEVEPYRKNMPTIRLSYLACSNTEKQAFRFHFPFGSFYDKIDQLINSLALYVIKTYHESYVKKYYRIPREHPLAYITSRLHTIYRQTSVPIDFAMTVKVLDAIPPTILDSVLAFHANHTNYF